MHAQPSTATPGPNAAARPMPPDMNGLRHIHGPAVPERVRYCVRHYDMTTEFGLAFAWITRSGVYVASGDISAEFVHWLRARWSNCSPHDSQPAREQQHFRLED